MDRFADLTSFVAVAQTGSLTRAAERLGTTKSVVSRRLAALEERLTARLVLRGPRGLSLTQEGHHFAARAAAVLSDLAAAESEIGPQDAGLKGTLRIAAPLTFGLDYLSPIFTAFALAHPEVALDVDLDDRTVDLVRGGFDLGVRIGRLPDSSLHARVLAPLRFVIAASPDYIGRRGEPRHPDELVDHDSLMYANSDPNPTWRLGLHGGELRSYRTRPRMRAGNGDVLRDAAAAGLGLTLLPTFIAKKALNDGRLVAVLKGWSPLEGVIAAVYPPGPPISPRARSFIETLIAAFATEPP